MNPTIIAAFIGIGGVVITAVAGFGANWRAARSAERNLKQTQDAEQKRLELTLAHDRERQLWDRKSAAYVDTVAFVERELSIWTDELHALSTIEDPSEFLRRWVQTKQQHLDELKQAPQWVELNARLVAFGSQPFQEAFRQWVARRDIMLAIGGFPNEFGNRPRLPGSSPEVGDRLDRSAATRRMLSEWGEKLREQTRALSALATRELQAGLTTPRQGAAPPPE